MNKVAKFELVSSERFITDIKDKFPDTDYLSDAVEEKIKILYDNMKTHLPIRGTSGSAGYDFFAPFSFTLEPGQAIVIPSCIRCKIDPDWVLLLFPRSSLGFKYHCGIANTIPVIDSDYYNSDNEGHIMIKLVNHGNKRMDVSTGDRFCQGIFLPYGITEDDACVGVRRGGIGSTGL